MRVLEMLFEAAKCVIISPASVCFIIHPAGLNPVLERQTSGLENRKCVFNWKEDR